MGLLFWRTDLMGPPRTPAELEAIASPCSKRGGSAGATSGRAVNTRDPAAPISRSFGLRGRRLRDGSPDLNSNAAIAASQWLRHLVDVGITPPAVANMAEPEALQTFETGHAAFMRNWPYAWAELNKNGSLLAGKVGITTMVSEPQEPHVATQGSWGLPCSPVPNTSRLR